jgi:hypothetical protein
MTMTSGFMRSSLVFTKVNVNVKALNVRVLTCYADDEDRRPIKKTIDPYTHFEFYDFDDDNDNDKKKKKEGSSCIPTLRKIRHNIRMKRIIVSLENNALTVADKLRIIQYYYYYTDATLDTFKEDEIDLGKGGLWSGWDFTL